MASNLPNTLLVTDAAKAAAVLATAQPVDAPRVPLSFDPIIGEQALVTCKAALLGIDPTQVGFPNCDAIQAAGVAMALADHIFSERCKPFYDQIAEPLLGEATVPMLRTYAQTLFYLETRARSKIATSNEIRVDGALVSEGVEARERMIKVLAYHCESEPDMRVELASIRSGTGYVDLASDLARLATHYYTHRETIAVDKVHYKAADEDRARGISKEIVEALHAASDNTIIDLRNRCWTKVLRVYAKLKAAMDFVFIDSPIDLATFPSLRHAVMQAGPRTRGGVDVTTDEGSTPVAPVAPVPPGPAPNPGTGPGGNPLI